MPHLWECSRGVLRCRQERAALGAPRTSHRSSTAPPLRAPTATAAVPTNWGAAVQRGILY